MLPLFTIGIVIEVRRQPPESVEVARGSSNNFKHKIDERGSRRVIIVDGVVSEVPLKKVDRGFGSDTISTGKLTSATALAMANTSAL